MTLSNEITHALKVIRPALQLASSDFLDEIAGNLRVSGVQAAVARHDDKRLFDWIVRLLSYQGISDRIAFDFDARHGGVSWDEINDGLMNEPACQKLRSYWHFENCSYRKGAGTCSQPLSLPDCPLAAPPLRKGSLNQAAFGLFLFMRDVGGGDFVRWIDERLAKVDLGRDPTDRSHKMMASLVGPLSNVVGTGPKLWSMILANLLLGGDPRRQHWLETGASMIAIDTLVHALFYRTGILNRFESKHPYGAGCYASGGCADIVRLLALHVDAREFNPLYPAYFPRFIQSAIWAFCAQSRHNICNGNQISDRERCQSFCPAFSDCDRIAFRS